jgi:hypothetical protein
MNYIKLCYNFFVFAMISKVCLLLQGMKILSRVLVTKDGVRIRKRTHWPLTSRNYN